MFTALAPPIDNVPMLGKGIVILDRLDSLGLSTGGQFIGNVAKLSLEAKDDTAEQSSSMNSTAEIIASALKKRTLTVTINGTDFSSGPQSFAAMSGGKSILAVTTSTVTAEPLVSATAKHAGRYFRTAKMNIDPATAPVLTNGVLPLVAGVDYTIEDYLQGWIRFTSATAAVDGTPTTITYHTLPGTFDEVAGASVARIKTSLAFSPDPTDGQKIALDIWKINWSPSGSMEYISDDYGNWTMEGLVLADRVNHPTCPFYKQRFLPS